MMRTSTPPVSAVVECSDLSEEQGAAEFRAALEAIRDAEQRLASVG